MPQLVFEFTSDDIDAVVTAVRRVVRDTRCECEMARQFLQYEPCSSFLDGVEALRGGLAVSVVLRPNASQHTQVRYVLVNSPGFGGAKLDAWLGTIEYIDPNWDRVWKELLDIEGLHIACLGFEEGPELDNLERPSITEFPWTAPSLIIGAVRDETNEWEIRRGTHYVAPTA